MIRRLFFNRESLRILIEWSLGVLLVVLSIRVFLFGTGFFEYSDQSWPPTLTVLPPGVFAPSVYYRGTLYFAQFARDIVTWPIVPIRAVSPDSQYSERLFYLYAAGLLATATYSLSYYVVKWTKDLLPSYASTPTALSMLRMAVFLFGATNIFAMNVFVDGGVFTDNLVFISGTFAILALVQCPNRRFALMGGAAMLSLGLFLDPDYFPFLILGAIIALGMSGILRESFIKRLKEVGLLVLLLLPALIYVVLGYDFTLVSGGPYMNVRAFTFDGLISTSANLAPLNATALLGQSWASMTFAPPDIYAHSTAIGSLSHNVFPSFPPQVLNTGSLIAFLWFVSLLVPMIFAICSLLSRRSQSYTLPTVAALLLGYALTQIYAMPFLSPIILSLLSIPGLGGLIGTVLAEPAHAIILIASAETLLLPIGIAFLPAVVEAARGAVRRRVLILTRRFRRILYAGTGVSAPAMSPRNRYRSLHSRHSLFPVLCVFVILVLSFADWQAFNGDYYPSRSYPTYLSGNGVPNTAPFDPVQYPAEVQQIYDYLLANANGTNAYWPSNGILDSEYGLARSYFNPSDPAAPAPPLPALPSLLAANLSASLFNYCQTNDVGFIAVEKAPSSVLTQLYGLSSYGAIVGRLSSMAGITLVSGDANVSLFKVAIKPFHLLPVELAAYQELNATQRAISDDVASLAGFTQSGVDSSTGLPHERIDNLTNCVVCILSPSDIANGSKSGSGESTSQIRPSQPTLSLPGDATDVGFANLNLPAVNLSPGQSLSLLNWSVISWGPSSISLSNRSGLLSLESSNLASASLSFDGLPLPSNQLGISVVQPSTTPMEALVTLSFWISPGYEGNISIYSFGVTTSNESTGGPSDVFMPALGWNNVTESVLVPGSLARFSILVETNNMIGRIGFADIKVALDQPAFNYSLVQGQGNDEFDDWTVTDWSTSQIATAFDGSEIAWSTGSSASTISLSYNGSLTGGAPGGIYLPHPNSTEESVILTLNYSTSMNFSGQLNLGVLALNSEEKPIFGSQVNLPIGSENRSVTAPFTLPQGTSFFTGRIEVEGLIGSFFIHQFTINSSSMYQSGAFPFGESLLLGNASWRVPADSSGDTPVFLAVEGTGVVGSFNVTQNEPAPLWISLEPGREYEFRGKLVALAAMSTGSPQLDPFHDGALLYGGVYYPNLHLICPDFARAGELTDEGLTLFENASACPLSSAVLLSTEVPIDVAYPVVTFWIIALFIVGATPARFFRIKTGRAPGESASITRL